MAWYNDGIWNDLRIDRTGHLLHQMCYAINERENAVGRTLSTWDGLGSTPAAYLFDGIRMDKRFIVLELIRDAIPTLYDYHEAEFFVQSDGNIWTASSLFSAAGYGGSWIELDGTTVDDIAPFMQTRAVIEELIYYTESYPGTFTDLHFSRHNQYTGATQEISYDTCISGMPASVSAGSISVGYGQTLSIANSVAIAPSSNPSAQLEVEDQYTIQGFDTSPTSFLVYWHEAHLAEQNSILLADMDPIDITLNGVSFQLDVSGFYPYSDPSPRPFRPGIDFPITPVLSGGKYNVTITCLTSFPADHPFTPYTISAPPTTYRCYRALATAGIGGTVLKRDVLTLTPTYG